MARSIRDPYQEAGAIIAVTRALAQAGHLDKARTVATHTETVSRSITDPGWQADILIDLAETLAKTGHFDQAEALAAHAETVSRSITHPDRQTDALIDLAETLAHSGNPAHARRVAATVSQRAQWNRLVATVLYLEPAAAGTVSALCADNDQR
jgi:thioredoxin-like negative regulator of GroEL